MLCMCLVICDIELVVVHYESILLTSAHQRKTAFLLPFNVFLLPISRANLSAFFIYLDQKIAGHEKELPYPAKGAEGAAYDLELFYPSGYAN